MSDDLSYTPATELVAAYRSRKLSPVEATAAALARIEKHNPRLNAFYLVDAEGALRTARDSEARWLRAAPLGPLDGVPMSIKDHQLTKGWPSPRGSRTTDATEQWVEDGPAVARLRESGAVFLGKTTMPEFGWKGVNDSVLFGITRNPWNPDKTPGGSSGGASAAVAAGMGPLALGSDGGGSIRIPCAFTGLVGLKATYGRVPMHPPSPYGTISHVGPMSRTVADCALMMNVIARPDPRDWFALPADQADYLAGLDDGIKGRKVAFSANLGYAKVDPEVAGIVAAAAQRFAALGAIVEARDPGFADPTDYFLIHWQVGSTNALRAFSPEKVSLVDPGLVEFAEAGKRVSIVQYLAAVAERTRLGVHMNRFHENWDLLLTPALAVPAFDVGLLAPPGYDGLAWLQWTPFSYPFNLTQQPAVVVPCGFTRAGLPIGLQIVGNKYREALVLRAARAYETAYPLTERRPLL
ncbi:MAG: amidase [Alphaproteobacteria bacterium]|nr:amidase [Alphaproteobacteria bacterium]